MMRKRNWVVSVMATAVILAGTARLGQARERSETPTPDCAGMTMLAIYADAMATCGPDRGWRVWDISCSERSVEWSLQCDPVAAS
jgi:hypothetical protein